MELQSAPLIGIALAIASAAALAVGNLLQARGVRAIEAGAALGSDGSKTRSLLRNHFWLIGTLLLGVTVLLQMGSLTFAPLMVVQPVGVVALVFTALLTAMFTKKAPSRQVVRSIAICVLGVAGFVTVAAMVSTQHAITDVQLVAVLVVLAVLLATTALVWFLGRRRRIPPVIWVLLGGIYSAFVATLGKTVILRVQSMFHSGGPKWDMANLLTIACILGIGIAGGLSVYFVQKAHAFNRPEVVVAGLTVVDPAIAVVLGIAILGEASGAPAWAFLALAAAGAVAMSGVFALSRAESRTQ